MEEVHRFRFRCAREEVDGLMARALAGDAEAYEAALKDIAKLVRAYWGSAAFRRPPPRT